MTAEQYQRISAPFRTEKRTKMLCLMNRILTMSCYVLYPVLLVVLFTEKDARFLRAVLVPGISFVLLSLFRKCVNFRRPYELLEIDPLIHKATSGKSFPSRHVFSVFMIAFTFLWIFPAVGCLLLVVGVLLALIRVIGGVHFPRDVFAGALFGVAAALVGYVILP